MGEEAVSYELRIEAARRLVMDSARIVAFTGAGISTESGLSDFRSPGGVWDRHRVVTFREFLHSAENRREYWAMKRDFYEELRLARPNKAHAAIAALERKGKLKAVITQNIDGLHQEAGNSPNMVIELHGTNRRAECLSCKKTWPIEDVHERVKAGDLDPRCDVCGGYIKPSTISFGQSMPEAELLRAFAESGKCGLMLMIGSSLRVEPAASIPPYARREGARLIFVNRTPTPWDSLADVLFTEDAGEVLEAIVGQT